MARSGPSQRGTDSISEGARLNGLIDELTFKERRVREEAPTAFEAPLIGRVLVGVGPDPASIWATEWAEALGPVFDPRVRLIHVETPLTNYPGIWGAPVVPEQADLLVAQEKAGLRLLDGTAERLRQAGLEVSVQQSTGVAVREIARAAREDDADLIIVGSPTRSALDRFLVGNIADGVKNHVDTNVLLAKGPPTPGDILCPVDGSWMSKRAAG